MFTYGLLSGKISPAIRPGLMAYNEILDKSDDLFELWSRELSRKRDSIFTLLRLFGVSGLDAESNLQKIRTHWEIVRRYQLGNTPLVTV